MDDEEFRKRLSEVAEWRIPKTEKEQTIGAKKRRGRKSNDELYMELREEIFHEEFDGINNTVPPMLVRVKVAGTICEDCGEYCPEGRHKEKKLYETGGKKNRHWRERCITCDRQCNPFTGKYDLTNQKASGVWAGYLRETKGMYKTKGNMARAKVMKPEVKNNLSTVIDNDQEMIRIYQEKTETDK